MMIQALLGAGAVRQLGNGVITESTWTSGGLTYYGFDSTRGSATGTTLTDGKTVIAIYNYTVSGNPQAEIVISGFSSSPGKSYLSSVTVESTTLNVDSTSLYQYGGGVASWRFGSSFGMDGSGTSTWSAS